jgi:hypothetical protein
MIGSWGCIVTGKMRRHSERMIELVEEDIQTRTPNSDSNALSNTCSKALANAVSIFNGC